MNRAALDSDEWRDALAAIARAKGWPSAADPEALATHVRALSDAYNEDARATMSGGGLAARLGFSFARDVPKSAEAVRELIALRLLALKSDRALRVLDVGAGLGASTWGVARALAAAGNKGEIDATLVEPDLRALDLAAAIARTAPKSDVILHVHPEARPASSSSRGPFDLILVGQALSEMNLDSPADARVASHVALVERLVAELAEDGSLVIVEPALRDRTRHLHAVRDALLARPASTRVTLFAPCLHVAPCPALARDGDWCHEKRAVNLPEWLVPVARAAGLRWEGLSFSYLILRKDGRSLLEAARAATGKREVARLRLVSDRIATKGKEEAFFCGENGASENLYEAGRLRARRIEREASDANAAWETLSRGDLVVIDPRAKGEGDGEGARANQRLSLVGTASTPPADIRVRPETRVEKIDITLQLGD